MHLRLNIAEDAELRTQILTMIRGCLREFATNAIAAAVREEGWLQKRLDAYLDRHPIDGVIKEWLAKTNWQRPAIMTEIIAKIREIVKEQAAEQAAVMNTKFKGFISECVKDELRKALAAIGAAQAVQ